MMAAKKVFSMTLVKYILSFSLIFSIPLLIMGGLMYKNMVMNVKKEIEAANMDKLQQVKEAVEGQMKVLQHIAAKISYDPRLTSYMVRNDIYTAKEAITELDRYKESSGIIDDLFLFFRGDSTIYSSRGLTSLATFLDRYYKFENWGSDTFIQDINGTPRPIMRPSEKVEINNYEEKRYLTYVVPIPFNQDVPFSTVLFMINETLLTNLFEHVLGEKSGSVFILDENKKLLATKSKKTSLVFREVADSLHNIQDTGVYNFHINGEEQSVVYLRSELNGWSYVVSMPTSQFLARVVETKTLLFYVLLSLTSVGLTLIILLSIRQYKPIRGLMQYIQLNWSGEAGKSTKNELELIHDTLVTTFDSNQQLREQVDAQLPVLRERFLTDLLKGSFKSKEELQKNPFYQEFIASDSSYIVMLLAMEKERGEDGQRAVFTGSTQLSFAGGEAYAVELIHEGALALVVVMNEGNDIHHKVQSFAKELHKSLEDKQGVQATIGIGTPCAEPEQIGISFIEASAAMEYKMKAGVGSIIFFEDIMALQEHAFYYSVEEQVRFMQSLKQGNETVAQEALAAMLQSIYDKSVSILLVRCMCFDIINAVFKTISQMNVGDYSHRIRGLLEFQSLQELENRLTELVSEICGAVQSLNENKNMALRDDIVQFVHEHFRNYDLGLDQVAVRFHLSASSLSRYFKEQMGSNFTEYISDLRIEEVKRELLQTNKSIQAIIQDVGYEDISQFRRKFKKLEGVTPAQYRSLYAKNSQ
ncbi:helix-turn-helix domain-containing protein [Paenibacillus sp. LMG 31458]|uniref:Helix-turn-helix domain-containing protein n=2 Tax=Paenibacillus phytorum TaxID=2654977 RepID=A0ABX1Y7G1_9BACL|nr:helix-turn-helix domain-containing protein [Paenibacillus phytorum]